MFHLDLDHTDIRLVLAEPRYAEALYDTVDANRDHLRKWMPWVDKNQEVKDSESFLRMVFHEYTAQSQLQTLMFKGDECVGIVGFNTLNHLNHHGEIGYWLAEKHTGNGYVTEAVKKMLQIGFEHFALNRIVIRAATNNNPSRAIPEKLGFVHEGTERESGYLYGTYIDLEVYSLLRKEWQ